MKRWGLAAAWLLAGLVSVSTMPGQAPPPGAHRADEPRQDPNAVLMRDAESALEKQDYTTAEAKLTELASKRPGDAQVLYDLGFAQEGLGKADAAAESYRRAIAADGGLAEPRVALGLLEARAGKAEAARKELKGVATMSTAAPELRGRALRALARLDASTNAAEAREDLLAAMKLTGETADDTTLAAELAERAGAREESEAAYRRALAANPGDADATAGLAHALLAQGHAADAETLLKPALEAHPGDPRLGTQMAAALAAEGKTDAALTLLEDLRGRSPQVGADRNVGRMLAQLYALAGQEPKAETLYRQLAEANPADPALLDALGGVLVKEQKYAEAQAALARAVADRPGFHDDKAWGEAAGHLAFAASRNGHPELTLQALSARATVLADTAASLFLEATAHDSLHQYQQAAKAYRAFLAMANGKFPDEEFEARHRLVALKSMK